MSDRLPRAKGRPSPDLASGQGVAPGDQGDHGGRANGSVGEDAREVSGVHFLGINGVLGPIGQAEDIDSDFSAAYPALWEYVTVRSFHGKPRETATMLFFREDGQWKLCLCDRDTDRVLFRSGDSVTECLESIEKALVSPRADWRGSRRSARR